MEKLIENVPKFNQKVFKKGLFIEVTKDGKKTNGIITNATEDRVYYRNGDNMPDGVGVSEVVDGKIQIKVARSLGEADRMPETIRCADVISMAPTYKRLSIITNSNNRAIEGVTFKDVVIDGLLYTRKTLAD